MFFTQTTIDLFIAAILAQSNWVNPSVSSDAALVSVGLVEKALDPNYYFLLFCACLTWANKCQYGCCEKGPLSELQDKTKPCVVVMV